jgi:stage II sporulation protein AB (anti-sigma F factor)
MEAPSGLAISVAGYLSFQVMHSPAANDQLSAPRLARRPGEDSQCGTGRVAAAMAGTRKAGRMKSPMFAMAYPAVPESVTSARRGVQTFASDAGAPEEALGAIALVVSEAVTNAIVHAYPQAGLVYVEAQVERGQLCLEVSDEGVGMNGAGPSPGLGMGLRFMDTFSDELSVGDAASGGVVVRARFSIA